MHGSVCGDVFTFKYKCRCMINVYVCWRHLPPSRFSALRRSPWITVGGRERTHALHGEMLYPTIPSAAPDASAGASVGAPQIGSRLVLYSFVWWQKCNNVEV